MLKRRELAQIRTLARNRIGRFRDNTSSAGAQVILPAHAATCAKPACPRLQCERVGDPHSVPHFLPADMRWDRNNQGVRRGAHCQGELSGMSKLFPHSLCQLLGQPVVAAGNDLDRHRALGVGNRRKATAATQQQKEGNDAPHAPTLPCALKIRNRPPCAVGKQSAAIGQSRSSPATRHALNEPAGHHHCACRTW